MFDRTELYGKLVKPHLEEAYKLCVIYKIPFFSSCCVKDNGKESIYENMINGSVSNGIHLANDQFSRHINVANGFHTYLHDRGTDIDFDFDCPELEELDEADVPDGGFEGGEEF